MRQNGLKPLPSGDDGRNEGMWEPGKDKPDRRILLAPMVYLWS
jgi:hypothetical protein